MKQNHTKQEFDVFNHPFTFDVTADLIENNLSQNQVLLDKSLMISTCRFNTKNP